MALSAPIPSPLCCPVQKGTGAWRACRCRHKEEDPWRKRQKGYEPHAGEPAGCSPVLYVRAPYGAPMAGVTGRFHLFPEQKVASFSMPIVDRSAASARFRAWLILQA
jgi:hypothetical protein